MFLFSAVSAWAYLPWWERAFRSDGSPLSWLSSSLLFANAVIIARQGIEERLPGILASCLAIALMAMALDEQFLLHEYWKFHCADWTSLCHRPSVGQVDWVGDAPMMLVGGAGLVVFAALLKQARSPGVRVLLITSVTIGVVLALGTHFGRAMNLLPPPITRFEELFEVIAETLFLCAAIEFPEPPGVPTRQVQSAS